MSKIKSVSTYTRQDESSGYWSSPTPLGADIENIDITNKVQNGTDETSVDIDDHNLIIQEGDTGAIALTKINKLKQRLVNALNPFSNTSIAKAIILAAHPIGSYYWSDDSTNPAQLFGGKWVRVKGVFLFAADDSHPAGSEGGSATHTLTLEEMPQHEHRFPRPNWYMQDSLYGGDAVITTYTWDHSNLYTEQACIGRAGVYDPVGGSQPHNNMPPYLAVYCWRRTA